METLVLCTCNICFYRQLFKHFINSSYSLNSLSPNLFRISKYFEKSDFKFLRFHCTCFWLRLICSKSCLNTFAAKHLKKPIPQCQAFLQKSLHFRVLTLNDYILVTCQWILTKFSMNDTHILFDKILHIFIDFEVIFGNHLESIFRNNGVALNFCLFVEEMV